MPDDIRTHSLEEGGPAFHRTGGSPSLGLRLSAALVLVAAAGVAGLYFGNHVRTTDGAASPAAGEEPRTPEPLVFVLDHPPIVCHDANKPVSFEVPVVNRSAEAVRFQHFACDCGCTSARIDREALAPGESLTVRLVVNLSGREGPQRFACHWQDESGTRWSAVARVTVYRPAQFEPAALRLGQVTPDETIRKTIHYDEYAPAVGELPPSPTFLVSAITPEPVKLSVQPPVVETLGPGLLRRRTAITVTLTVPNRGGYSEAFLTTIGLAKVGQPASVHLSWSVREAVELSPARLALSFPETGEGQQRQVVRVSPLDGQPFVIERVTTSDPGIQARVTVAPRSSTDAAVVGVSVTLPEGRRVLVGEVILHLRTPGACEVRIPVTAFRAGGS